MYSELDVHNETFIDPLKDHLDKDGDFERNCVVGTRLNAVHPVTTFTITQPDGRVFETLITTKEEV